MSNKCPRGFVVSESTGKCIPEDKSISDRLMLKYERYFFKEDKDMEKCKPGYRWCSKTNKCVEDTDDKLQGKRLGRGQGEGPMGKPFKEAEDMVDIAFDEGFEVFTKLKVAKSKVDDVLDNLQLECGCQQGAGMGREKGYMRSQMGGFPGEEEDEYEDAYDAMDHIGPNDIDAVPDEKVSNLYRSVRKQMGEWRKVTESSKNERYKRFFRKMLSTYGVESPDDIDNKEDKKEFFNKVNRGWQTKKEKEDVSEWSNPFKSKTKRCQELYASAMKYYNLYEFSKSPNVKRYCDDHYSGKAVQDCIDDFRSRTKEYLSKAEAKKKELKEKC